MLWKKFNAMGTDIVISASLNENQAGLLEDAEKSILEFEKQFSRFDKESELSRFNDVPGGKFDVSPKMADILKEMKIMHIETGGIFDPTIIESLQKIGYDKSFNKITNETKSDTNIKPEIEKIKQIFFSRPRIENLNIFDNTTVKPDRFKVDFGGIGKGYITDILAKEIFKEISDFWISAGGDLIIKGNDENKVGWEVGIQDPNTEEKKIFYIKTKGENLGIATSGIGKRKGESGGLKWHHLIDPRTGLPVENDILAVTVISSSAMKADVFAKTVLILGKQEAFNFIDSKKDSACIVFFKNGEVTMSKRAVGYF